MRRVVGVGVIAVLGLACADELAENAGEMLKGAGQVIADAGAALADAGAGDAQAQAVGDGGSEVATPQSETYEVTCDQPDVLVVNQQRQYTTWLATLATDTANITGVDVIQCREAAVDPCSAPNDCSGSTMPRPPLARCTTGTAEIGDGFVRVDCTGGYKTARFTVRR